MSGILNAILAMDVYQRGYHQGIFGLSDAVGTQIGTATLGQTRDDAVSQSAGFYAASYNVDGQTVISYRGTDEMLWSENGGPFSWDGDVARGWLMGGGVTNTPWLNQATLAIQFYQDVTGSNVHNTSIPNGVSLTGHSLGGGLAGFIASMTGLSAEVYDNMPFGLAAYVQVDRDAKALGGENYDLATLGLRAPTLGNIHTTFIDGEVLEAVRQYAPAGAGLLQYLGDVFGPGNLMMNLIQAQFNAITTTSTAAALENMVAKTEIPNLTVGLVSTEVHSMALLVAMEYGKAEWDWDNEPGVWRDGAKFVLSNIMNDEIGTALGRISGTSEVSATGYASAGGQMATMIAYTAIEEGEQPFGNVAIKAMFDDMTDLGTVARSLGSSNAWFNAHSDELGKIAVNFAGRMAVGEVALDEADDEDDNGEWDPDGPFIDDGGDDEGPDLLGGAILVNSEFDYSSPNLSENILSIRVDATRELWDQGLFSRSSNGLSALDALVSSDNRQIVGLYDLHSSAIDEATTAGINLGTALVTKYGFTPLNLFETYTFVLGEGRYGITSAANDEGLGLVKVEADVAITAGSYGDEVMQAWSGGSTLYGLGGNDMLVGGMSNDTLVGGAGSMFLGGKGSDVLGAEWGYTIGQTEAVFADGGEGFDILSYAGAESVVVDAVNHTVTIGDRVDTFVNIESVTGGYGWNEYYGNGQMQFSGLYGDDTFFLKIGDSARGNSGFDVASFENVQGGISMSAGGIIRNANPGSALSHVNDVNMIIGTASADHFTGENFDIFEYESLVFVGEQGADTFDLYNLNKAWGGEGADKFYVHLSADETLINLEELTKEDSLFIVMGQTSLRLTGNSLSVSFRADPIGTEGSYNLLEKVHGTSQFSADVPERYIGGYNARTQTYLKDESVEITPSWGEHHFFEFSTDYQSGIINLKADGYGELKIIIDYVDPDNFGLEYTTLPGGEGSRYDGQAFNHANPTGSYSVDAASFDDPNYSHLVGLSQLEQVYNEFIYF